MSTLHPPVKRLNRVLINSLCVQAAASPRQRAAFNLHESSADPVQRFLNVMQPGTYVRPHRHAGPTKWELTVVLSGRVVVLLLEPDGVVRERIELDASGPERGVELPPGVWHTCAALSPAAVLLEIKRGPYNAQTDKDFAAWAPPEGETECANFELRFRAAQPGDRLAARPPRDSQSALCDE